MEGSSNEDFTYNSQIFVRKVTDDKITLVFIDLHVM